MRLHGDERGSGECRAVDVLVVGAGTAGRFAALAAAGEGVRVMLLERDFAPGGVGVRAGVHVYWYGSTGGYQQRIDRLTFERAKRIGVKSAGFHPDAKRTVMAEALLESGADVVFGAIVFEVLTESGAVKGVRAATMDGAVMEVSASVIVDATGDGDVAAAAGADYDFGRPEDGITHVYSLVPRVIGKGDKIDNLNFDAGWVDPTDPWDVSEAYREGRKHIGDLLAESTDPPRLLSVSPQIGIRESRRIRGRYVLTFDDLVRNRRFDDRITHCFTHYDNHAHDKGNESLESQIWRQVMKLERLPLECDIPYRSLLPDGIGGLLIACRAISLDRDAAAGIRMQRDMQKVGEAAGTAAAMSARAGVEPARLDVRALQRRLIERGLLRPEEEPGEPRPVNVRFGHGWLAGIRLVDGTQAEPHIDDILTYLGGEEEGRALWWLRRIGEAAAEPLLALLNEAGKKETVRRAVVYALALIGREEAVPWLLESVRRSASPAEEGAGGGPAGNFHHSGLPEWVNALVLLRQMRHPAAWRDAADVLADGCAVSIAPAVLRYLSDIAPSLDDGQRAYVLERVTAWLAGPGPEADYVMPRGKRRTVFRWSLELSAAELIARLGAGEQAERLARRHVKDGRSYARAAAAKTLSRLEPTGGEEE